jgi:DNA-binding LacI/PurR family transcriptional regulator
MNKPRSRRRDHGRVPHCMGKMTMKDISVESGVSMATVSRAIHFPHLVRPETRNRIYRVMDKLQYVYNATAGDLSRNRSSIIGVIIPTSKSLIFSSSLVALQEVAQENNYSLIIGSSRYDTRTERKLLQQFKERRLSGMILTGFVMGQESSIKELIQSGIPCVVIWDKLAGGELSYVGFDNFKATYSMTEYLIRLGHRHIGLIIGPFSKVERVRKRLDGFKAALEDHGLTYRPEWVLEKEPTLIDGKEAMKILLASAQRPTAVFAASDSLALGAMAAVREAGLKIPDDISLAGFDDVDVSAYFNPPLTTIRVPAYEIGLMAMKILLEMVNDPTMPVQQYCMETSLVVRGSCSAPRS